MVGQPVQVVQGETVLTAQVQPGVLGELVTTVLAVAEEQVESEVGQETMVLPGLKSMLPTDQGAAEVVVVQLVMLVMEHYMEQVEEEMVKDRTLQV